MNLWTEHFIHVPLFLEFVLFIMMSAVQISIWTAEQNLLKLDCDLILNLLGLGDMKKTKRDVRTNRETHC